MPGAGLKMTNNLFNVAPKDGTAFGMFGRGIALEPLIGAATVRSIRPNSPGSAAAPRNSVFVSAQGAGSRPGTTSSLRPFTVGGEGTGSDPDVYAPILKNVFGAKLKLISGYPGTAELAIAVERGEVDSRASWSWTSLKTLRPTGSRRRRSTFQCSST